MTVLIPSLAFELSFRLVLGHFLGDFLFQTDGMAKGKDCSGRKDRQALTWPWWMLGHAFVHGGLVYWASQNALFGAVEVVSHSIVDYGKCRGLYGLWVDQLLHLACKAAMVGIVLWY